MNNWIKATLVIVGVVLACYIAVALLSIRITLPTFTMQEYVATHRSAIQGLPIAVEFERIFPGKTDHFITHAFNRPAPEPPMNIWNSEAHFGGRYCLTMQVEVRVDYENQKITRAGDPTFYLVENYDLKPDLSYSGRGVATFTEAEWRKVYESGGDFSAIGVELEDRDPEAFWDQMVNAVRQRQVPITLLNGGEPAKDQK